MTVLRAHFDGKVFVPDEPLNLRPGSVTLQVIELDMDLHPVTGLTPFCRSTVTKCRVIQNLHLLGIVPCVDKVGSPSVAKP